ncbi:MAG: class I SAM-dependent methyltransferase [Nevskia sp.]|nr:class I SAM-dependent methyltransferase [Nevskia sp.]
MKSTERFSNRVEDYVRWRPGYPAELAPWLMTQCGLKSGDVAADVGCGTGLFTRELLLQGLKVIGVEPNAAMRAAGERYLAEFGAAFTAHAGDAEVTGLPSGTVNLVTAAQAFHWFRPVPTRAEFARILAPGGHVALIWNVRREATPFLRGYEALLREHAPEYAASGVPAQADLAVIRPFFAPLGYVERGFEYVQHFDREGLRGRLMSSSYAPAAGAPGHAPMLAAVDRLFDAHQRDGRVAFEYDTRVFVGRMA